MLCVKVDAANRWHVIRSMDGELKTANQIAKILRSRRSVDSVGWARRVCLASSVVVPVEQVCIR